MNKWRFLLLILSFLGAFHSTGQDLPSCGQRDFIVDFPRVVSIIFCIEHPLETGDAGEWAFTALAFTEAGNFYATRPQTGELLQLVDSDGDSLPDTVTIVADGMRLPNGLAVAGNRLYIIGDGAVYRYADGELATIADDLPHGRGFMASGIAVQEGLIYVGIPYPCNACEVDNELYGTVLRMDENGENRQIVARGLRYPAGLGFYQEMLYVSDTARDDAVNGLDEINRIDLASPEIPDFGLTNCFRELNLESNRRDFICREGVAPQWFLLGHSVPFAFEVYDSDYFPWLTGSLLLSIAGSFDNSEIRGYSLVALKELANGQLYVENILPNDHTITSEQVFRSSQRFISTNASEVVNRRGAGIWGHRLYDAAVSPEGWIYASVGGEGIFVLRYGDSPLSIICERWRDCP